MPIKPYTHEQAAQLRLTRSNLRIHNVPAAYENMKEFLRRFRKRELDPKTSEWFNQIDLAYRAFKRAEKATPVPEKHWPEEENRYGN